MAVDLLLGLQWGDEGKGKIVDVLTELHPSRMWVRKLRKGTLLRSYLDE